MNFILGLIIALMVSSPPVSAGMVCPQNMCNPFNGCMDGCSMEQKICSIKSVQQCIGKQILSPCNFSGSGKISSENSFCEAIYENHPVQWSCRCN